MLPNIGPGTGDGDKPRNCLVTTRVTEDEKRMLYSAAESRKMSISDFIRLLIKVGCGADGVLAPRSRTDPLLEAIEVWMSNYIHARGDTEAAKGVSALEDHELVYLMGETLRHKEPQLTAITVDGHDWDVTHLNPWLKHKSTTSKPAVAD